MGKTYKRADGRWAQDLWIDGKRKTLYGRTRKEVQGKVDAARAAARIERARGTAAETVQAFCVRWLDDVARIKVRSRTHDRYGRWLRQLYPTLGPMQLGELRTHHVQRTYAGLLASGMAPKSLQLLHRVFRQALTWGAATDESLTRNPTNGVVLPRVEQGERVTLSGEQFCQIIAGCGYDDYRGLWAVLGYTGMRLGEASGLRWSDWRDGWLHVERSLGEEARRGHVLSEPKTQKGRRAIWVAPELASILREHKAEQNTRRLQNILWRDGDWIFATSTGDPLWRSHVSKVWKRLLRENDLPDMRIHDLRHTTATILANRGVPMEVISVILGHASTAVTSGIYAHIAPATTREPLERLGEILSGKERKA